MILSKCNFQPYPGWRKQSCMVAMIIMRVSAYIRAPTSRYMYDSVALMRTQTRVCEKKQNIPETLHRVQHNQTITLQALLACVQSIGRKYSLRCIYLSIGH